MREPLTRSRTLRYSAGSVGAGAFYAFNNFVLPQLLRAAGAGDLLTGLLSSTRSIEGAIIQPTVGALSDRTRSRLGRRRPFIALGIPLSAAFFVFAATQRDVLGLTIAIVLFSIFFNVAADPYVALLADITGVGERGILQGVSTGIQLASQVAFLVLISVAAGSGGVPTWSYVLVAALLVGTFAITVAGVGEPPIVDRTEERLGLAAACVARPAGADRGVRRAQGRRGVDRDPRVGGHRGGGLPSPLQLPRGLRAARRCDPRRAGHPRPVGEGPARPRDSDPLR